MAVSVSHRFVDEGTGRVAGAFLLNIGEMRVEVNRLRKKRKKLSARFILLGEGGVGVFTTEGTEEKIG